MLKAGNAQANLQYWTYVITKRFMRVLKLEF